MSAPRLTKGLRVTGGLDGVHRQRRRAPPKGWHLPHLALGQAKLDSFDFI